MVKLAKFLNWCFALTGLAVGALCLLSLWSYLHSPHSRIATLTAGKAAVLSLLFGGQMAVAMVFGMAWWTIRKGRSSARGWAIAASTAEILFSAVPVVAKGTPIWLVTATGVAGLFVFSRRGVLAQIASRPESSPRLPGDGTSKFVDTAVRLAGYGCALLALFWWTSWADRRHLPLSDGFSLLFLLLLADLICVAVHESGHALAGLALRMKIRSFVVGPFQWQLRHGKLEFEFHPSSLFASGGRTGFVHAHGADSRWLDVCTFAGGPLASLCLGLVALWATFTAPGRPWQRAWELLAFTAVFSLVGFVTNLLPIRPEASYSDGARIYQLLSGGAWADAHRAFSIAGSSAFTPLRPKDYDIQAIQRAGRFLTRGRQALFLRLLAYFHFLDCNRIPEAIGALAEAESVQDQSPSDIGAEVYAEFVFGNAFLKHDAAAAHLWWEKLEAGKPRRDDTDYWLARSALLWIENHPEEAREAWNTGYAIARQRPAAGAYEFDRDRFARLREAFESTGSLSPA
jgi:hypothetical protein